MRLSKLQINIFQSHYFIFLLILLGCSQDKKKDSDNTAMAEQIETVIPSPMNGSIYTSAHQTNLKLTLTDAVNFGDIRQPVEPDIDILVDQSKQFQTVLGIGAALTDAAAETYYKLTPENQNKFMEAYYSQENGIGYSGKSSSILFPSINPYVCPS